MTKPIVERAKAPSWQTWVALCLAMALVLAIAGLGVAFLADVWGVVDTFRHGRPPERSWTNWALWMLGAVMVVVMLLGYASEWASKSADYAHVKDKIDAGHAFFLYLRPFAIERRLLLDVPMTSGIPYLWALAPVRQLLGFEPNLKRAMARVGAAMVAIGEMDRNPGIAKLTPTDAEWQALFVDLAKRSRGIFIVPFTTAGSQWELDWILVNALDKAIIVLPPVHADPIVGLLQNHDLGSHWQTLRARYADRVSLPDYQTQGMMLTLRRQSSAPDVTFPLDRSDLELAIDHLLGAGRLGDLVEL